MSLGLKHLTSSTPTLAEDILDQIGFLVSRTSSEVRKMIFWALLTFSKKVLCQWMPYIHNVHDTQMSCQTCICTIQYLEPNLPFTFRAQEFLAWVVTYILNYSECSYIYKIKRKTILYLFRTYGSEKSGGQDGNLLPVHLKNASTPCTCLENPRGWMGQRSFCGL